MEVQLLDGPFYKAQENNNKILKSFDPDRFLARFRIEAGLSPKSLPYEGWESESIAGHSLGHFMSAIALMSQSNSDTYYLDQARYIIDELQEVQLAHGDGYVGAIPGGKRIFQEEIALGNITPYSFNLNGIWAPFYSMHKIMAGLRDIYRLCGIEEALEVEKGFARWIGKITASLDHEKFQEMLDCEHGGINEVFADLYADTGDEEFLNLSLRFHHEKILDSLAMGHDVLPGIHANTQIPKLVGLAKRYSLTSDDSDYQAASFFWDRVANHHSYVTGGNGNHEYFGPPDQLSKRLSNESTETCNVYNMLKLTDQLFQLKPDPAYAAFYERALINQILSSQHPETGQVLYNQSLEMGGKKRFQNPEWFTCCVGTGMENHAKHANFIYFKKESGLYVNLFIASQFKWEGYTIKQRTRFPEEQQAELSFETNTPKELTLFLRYPDWATKGFALKLNGEPMEFEAKRNSYVELKRTWQNGDQLTIEFPFDFRLEATPDNENRVAIMYGPLVMAGDLSDWEPTNSDLPTSVPVLMARNLDPASWISKEGEKFFVNEVAYPVGFELKPLYQVTENPYSVYWDLHDKTSWQTTLEFQEAKKKALEELEARTTDTFLPGDSLQENLHNFQGDSIYIQHFRGRNSRVANRGGRFSFEMKVPDEPWELWVEYWGGFTGTKTFDIEIDDIVVGTENISGMADGEFLFRTYELPKNEIVISNAIEVKFNPHPGHRAGPIFSARTVLKRTAGN